MSPNGEGMPRRLVAIFIVVVLGIVVLGWWAYSAEESHLRQREYGQLQAVSHFKAAQIADWLAERRWDAQLVFGSDQSRQDFTLWLEGRGEGVTERLTARLQSMLINANYVGLELVDSTGRKQLLVGSGQHDLSELSPGAIAGQGNSTEPLLVDLHRHGADGPITLAYLMPIPAPGGRGPPQGFLWITIDPERTLYPLIQSWPTPSRSAETLIVRQDGNDVLFLNELRHLQDTALRFRLPLGRETLPAARAVLGLNGIFEGQDYRNIDVISYLQPVPGTPWRMVTKVDRSEVFQEIRQTGVKILLAGSLLLLASGSLLMMFWRRQQVLARLQMGQELERVADLSPGIIHSFRLRPDGAAAFLYTSQAIKEVFGLEAEALMADARLVIERVHPDDLERMGNTLEASAKDLSPWVVEYRYRHPIKGEIWVEDKSIPTRMPDGSTIWHGFISEITERKRGEIVLEAQRAQLETEVAVRTAELMSVNKELQAFTYAVSHDLKAPLRGIGAFAALLERDYGNSLAGEGGTYLAHIRRSAVRMGALIDDLMAYAQVEQETRDLKAVDLAAAVRSILGERQEDIRQYGVELRVDLPDVRVRANTHGLAQVLRNLVDNALKYSAKSASPAVEIGGESRGGRCCLWVRDNGIGFDMAYCERIFEIFSRLHSDQDFPGTGVGLALVKKAMERMGGRVWAESAPGQGATFYLEFAIADDPAEPSIL